MRPENSGDGRAASLDTELHFQTRVENDEVGVGPQSLVVVNEGVDVLLQVDEPVKNEVQNEPVHEAELQVWLSKGQHLAEVFSKDSLG
jgi:hypothetical protein